MHPVIKFTLATLAFSVWKQPETIINIEAMPLEDTWGTPRGLRYTANREWRETLPEKFVEDVLEMIKKWCGPDSGLTPEEKQELINIYVAAIKLPR